MENSLKHSYNKVKDGSSPTVITGVLFRISEASKEPTHS